MGVSGFISVTHIIQTMTVQLLQYQTTDRNHNCNFNIIALKLVVDPILL